ncbi:MAG: phosphate propanoyltransferase [Candidatus Paceibacterota bacterium]|jgi:putative phosphotransacetylase
MNKIVKVEISAHHIHLNKDDFEKLFGAGAELTVKKELSQPGMFAANETVDIKDDEFEMKRVRIVGPIRNYTQVEITETEARNFRINPPLRLSGNIKDTPGITVTGPKGSIDIKEGVIVAKRHVHMTPKDAAGISIKDGDVMKVKVGGERGLIFDNVIARVDKTYAWACHIDTDEGNAAGMAGCGDGEVILS